MNHKTHLRADRVEEAGLPESFRRFVGDPAFPCVGAKAALKRGALKVVLCRSIVSAWNDVRIHQELLDWAKDYKDDPGLFRSLVFIFSDARPLSEQEFERALWARLQSLADKDAWLGQPYDRGVSADPNDPHFSLSFGGEAFFVVGLHPNASRPARRFIRPAMVFNLHGQFKTLREEGRYESIRSTIIERDVRLSGTPNPMIARHGESSEALQYSGRHVEPDWKCPFHDKRVESKQD